MIETEIIVEWRHLIKGTKEQPWQAYSEIFGTEKEAQKLIGEEKAGMKPLKGYKCEFRIVEVVTRRTVLKVDLK